ncbi:MAG: MogA/MoaB family molybdenum cofactor biosynthesis protein [Planctomycetota bacterium]|jgi:molybdenum cofactor biosynthesis protein B
MNDPTSGAREHEDAANTGDRPVSCAVLTISDSRTKAQDRSGDRIVERLVAADHVVDRRALVKDEPDQIAAQLEAWRDEDGVRAIITTGGTGVSLRDTTVEVVRSMIDIELDGFGELFRMLSYEEIGAAAMLSRAVAGIAPGRLPVGTLIFALPGSVAAVTLAMDKLIVPQLRHLVWVRS